MGGIRVGAQEVAKTKGTQERSPKRVGRLKEGHPHISVLSVTCTLSASVAPCLVGGGGSSKLRHPEYVDSSVRIRDISRGVEYCYGGGRGDAAERNERRAKWPQEYICCHFGSSARGISRSSSPPTRRPKGSDRAVSRWLGDRWFPRGLAGEGASSVGALSLACSWCFAHIRVRHLRDAGWLPRSVAAFRALREQSFGDVYDRKLFGSSPSGTVAGLAWRAAVAKLMTFSSC